MSVDLPQGLWPGLARLSTTEEWPLVRAHAAEAFVSAAAKEGLLPLLDASPGLPDVVRGVLDARRAVVRLSAARTEIQGRVLEELVTALGPVILLKGADYARRLYSSPDLRPMADLDILVRPEVFRETQRCLIARGFGPRYPGGAVSRLASYHEAVLVREDAMVEVHQAFNHKARHRVDYDGLWQRAVPAAHDPRARRLCDEDALAYHALSMACDELSVPLVRHVDLWLLMRPSGALGKAVERVKIWQARRALYGSLRQFLRLLPEESTAEVAASLEDLLPRRERLFLDRFVITALDARGDRRVHRAKWVFRKLLLMDGNQRRAAFAIAHARTLLRTAWPRARMAHESARA